MNDEKANGGCVNAGVRCDVRNCRYHAGECRCTAETVAVGPGFAADSADTVCATFQPKKN